MSLNRGTLIIHASTIKWTTREGLRMDVESTGHERGNPRMYALVENSPKTGKSPTVWAWPQFIDFLKVAGQPVQGPWPPHQEPRPDPDADSMPVAVRDTQQ
jgi:hypothetical protein